MKSTVWLSFAILTAFALFTMPAFANFIIAMQTIVATLQSIVSAMQ